MKTKNIINIFYFIIIFNYILQYKLNCLLTMLFCHIILYYIIKNNTNAILLSIILTMFLFCGKIIETEENICSDEQRAKCDNENKICINNFCYDPVCTNKKIKNCRSIGAVCQEPKGCVMEKKSWDLYNLAHSPKGFRGQAIVRPDLYNKRVDTRMIFDKKQLFSH